MPDLHTGFSGPPQEPTITGSFLDSALAGPAETEKTPGAASRWWCALLFPKGRKKEDPPIQKFFSTKQVLSNYCRVSADLGDVYHCNATFPVRGSRKKNENSLYRSVWIDSDLKPFDAALAALKSFLTSSCMLRPSITVASGGEAGGLHAYWLFNRDLSLAEWEPLAHGLCKLCELHSFPIDAKCTKDAVRILRPPGTLNHKSDYGEPRLVQAHTTGPSYDLDEFKEELAEALGSCGPSSGGFVRSVADTAAPPRTNGHDTGNTAFIKSAPLPYTIESFDRLCSALDSIPAACGHEPWMKIMFALKSLTAHGWPDEVCYGVLERWSATSPAHNVSDHIANNLGQWRGAGKDGGTRKNGGVTDAHIFDTAIKKGWRA